MPTIYAVSDAREGENCYYTRKADAFAAARDIANERGHEVEISAYHFERPTVDLFCAALNGSGWAREVDSAGIVRPRRRKAEGAKAVQAQ